MQKQILDTPRLILREMSPDDLDFVATMLADPEVMQFYPKCYSREEAATWIERQMRRYARHGHGLWLALDKMTGQPVGQVGLLIQNVHGVEEKEVAYPRARRGDRGPHPEQALHASMVEGQQPAPAFRRTSGSDFQF